ncbi:spore germination protein [Schinkia sp. CFF1]
MLNQSISKTLDEKITFIQTELRNSNDLYIRKFRTKAGQDGAILFLEGLTDQNVVNQSIFQQIFCLGNEKQITEAAIIETFPYSQLETTAKKEDIVNGILLGKVILVLANMQSYCLFKIGMSSKEKPEPPVIETTIKGTRAGFVESIPVNISIIRKYIKDPSLHIEEMKIGSLSKTNITILYIEGIVNKDVLQEVKYRLKTIKTDTIISASELEQWIEDNTWSVFPLIRLSERPDTVVESLNSGKVILFVENSAFALQVPLTFFESLQNMDDYYEKWYVSSMVRIIRLVAMLISVFVPSLFVALIHYNPELIPTDLLISIAHTRIQVPFPAILELLLMELMIEIFREAGIRLPKPLGQTVGIVGGIVIGDAAVQANIVSPITLIVVGITAMASFSTPHYSMAFSFRLIRLLLIIAAGFLGLYGLVLGYIFILVHLCSLKSFGVPYLVPFAPTRFRNWVDLFILFPLRWRTIRPTYLSNKEKQRTWKPLKKG